MNRRQERPVEKVTPLPQAPDAIELRHLRAFVAVAEELNFGRAASRLYLSQPALSRQIRTLERLIGCDLLRRSTHRVEITLAGEALLERARGVLSDLDDAVAATRSVGGEIAGRIARLWEPVADLTTGDADLQELRAANEEMHAHFSPPPEVKVRPFNAGGTPSLVLTPGSDRPPTLLYLHGGGYVLGSAFGYRPLAGALAVAAEAGVLLPEYRLAPEHPFPAALEDALRAYLSMLDSGLSPQQVIVAGDSVGAGLALSLLIKLKQQELPQPSGAVLLCPGVDPTYAPVPDAAAEPQPVLPFEQLRRFAAYYLAGHPVDDPVVSPLTADLTGLPPMLVQAATNDPLRRDALRLTDHARSHGVDVKLELYPADTHVFHLFWSFLPEAAEALRQAGTFVRATAHVADFGRRTLADPPPAG
ncbi:alpha/beta hydrolase fold domain-containing protein [Nonomuraea sp. NPDC050643]|uniref:alpha/beta hydrolase fold domain-containing protein n=1 Tax=Nonomuraea sp. NPDC050643 TaxID=3155660 RepID=UPI0033CF10EE